jgi:hypothetical protein
MSADQILNVKKTLPLSDGGSVVLVDMMGRAAAETWECANRNVYKLNAAGQVVWKIGTMSAPDERFPYTNIYFNTDGDLIAYCWDGGEYRVDVDAGQVDQGKLVK